MAEMIDLGPPLAVGTPVRLSYPRTAKNYRSGQCGRIHSQYLYTPRPPRPARWGEPEPEKKPPEWCYWVQFADGGRMFLDAFELEVLDGGGGDPCPATPDA